MFTGIIEDLGSITEISAAGGGRRLTIKTRLPLSDVLLGDSIAVDGVCLTVVEKSADTFRFDVSAESIARSTLGDRKVGDPVHLERALPLGGRLGGHLVQGHVDATGRIESLSPLGEATRVEFSCPPQVGRYLIEKGSIAVDGVSLTVNEQKDNCFSVVLIPHTLSKTAIVQKGIGGQVNLEVDLIAKYVERLVLPYQGSKIDLDFLRDHGFAPKE